MEKRRICLAFALLLQLAAFAQRPSPKEKATMATLFKAHLTEFGTTSIKDFSYQAIELDGDPEKEWIVLMQGNPVPAYLFFNTNPVRAIPERNGQIIVQPNSELVPQTMDVDGDNRQEVLIWFRDLSDSPINHATLLSMKNDNLEPIWKGNLCHPSPPRHPKPFANTLHFSIDEQNSIQTISLFPTTPPTPEKPYKLFAEKTSHYPRSEWEWVDTAKAFHQRIETIFLDSLLPGATLKYETMDVIFYLPYTPDIREQLRKPGNLRLYEHEEYTNWSGFKLPQFMDEWTQIAAKFRSLDHVEVNIYPEISRVIYILLSKELRAGRVAIFDKATGTFLREIRRSHHPEYYNCQCHDGSTVQGHTWKESFFAHTSKTGYLYFYTRQDRMGHECCMEEFPLRNMQNNDP